MARAIAVPSLRGTTLTGLVWALPVLLFQWHYETPLPFDPRLLPVAVAVALGVAGAGRRQRPAERPEPESPPGIFQAKRPMPTLAHPVTAVLALLLLVPLGFLTTGRSTPEPPDASTALRLLSWNIEHGRDRTAGTLAPQRIADGIRRVSADAVVLQGVSRGWFAGGGLDLAEWLSRELDMAYHWAPGADSQTGNLLLVPHGREVTVRGVPLPHGESYLHVRIGAIDIAAVRLAARPSDTAVRLAQIEALLAAKPHVVAGSLNFWPSWPERAVFTAAGYVSAQDVAGRPEEFTADAGSPWRRVDWIFGTPDVALTSFRIVTDATVSTHLPVVAMLSAPALAPATGQLGAQRVEPLPPEPLQPAVDLTQRFQVHGVEPPRPVGPDHRESVVTQHFEML